LWIDGFDPNNQSKKNRGSVYIRTVTFAPNRSFRNNLQNTYALAIGPDKCDRSIIDKHVTDGLAKLTGKNMNGEQKRYYCAAVGVEVEVNGFLISKLADQPERRKTLGLAGGNSTYHARFGTILDLNSAAEFVSPCESCTEKIHQGDRNFDKVRCEYCTQWNMEGEHPLLKFPVPVDYPDECLSDQERSSGKLSPRKLSLIGLRNAMQKAGKQLVEKSWTELEARSYLKIEGVNEEWTNNCIVFTRYAKKIVGENYDGVLTEEDENWAEQQLMDGTGFPMPEAWNEEMDFFLQNLDVPMHLLFLGLVKTAVKLIIKWCKCKRKYVQLVKKAKDIMRTLEKMGLSWLKSWT